MAIEADNDGGNLAVPQPNAAVLVAYREDVGIRLAAGDRGDLALGALIPPPAQQLAFLDIPYEDLLVRGNDRAARARTRLVAGSPDEVRGSRCDEAEGLGMFVLPEKPGLARGRHGMRSMQSEGVWLTSMI